MEIFFSFSLNYLFNIFVFFKNIELVLLFAFFETRKSKIFVLNIFPLKYLSESRQREMKIFCSEIDRCHRDREIREALTYCQYAKRSKKIVKLTYLSSSKYFLKVIEGNMTSMSSTDHHVIYFLLIFFYAVSNIFVYKYSSFTSH